MSGHQNSVESLQVELDEGRLARRAKLILETARVTGRSYTDRGMMRELGFADMNSVRPRITELIQRGFLVEDGTVLSHNTGKRVRRWRARGEREWAEFVRQQLEGARRSWRGEQAEMDFI